MPNWLRRLTGKPAATVIEEPPRFSTASADEEPPPFNTTLAVDSPGAPGRAGAEALYAKWSSRWQEF